MTETFRYLFVFAFAMYWQCLPAYSKDLAAEYAKKSDVSAASIERQLYQKGDYIGVIRHLHQLDYLSTGQHKILINAYEANSELSSAYALCTNILDNERLATIHEWALRKRTVLGVKLHRGSSVKDDDGTPRGGRRKIIHSQFEIHANLSEDENVKQLVETLTKSDFPIVAVKDFLRALSGFTETEREMLGTAIAIFATNISVENPNVGSKISFLVAEETFVSLQTGYSVAIQATAADTWFTTRSVTGWRSCGRPTIRFHRRRMSRHNSRHRVFCRR